MTLYCIANLDWRGYAMQVKLPCGAGCITRRDAQHETSNGLPFLCHREMHLLGFCP